MSTKKSNSDYKLNYVKYLLLIVILNTSVEVSINDDCPMKKIFDCRVGIRVVFQPNIQLNREFKEIS